MAAQVFDASAHARKIRTRQGMQDYLDVKWRILWLRSEHPDTNIVTELVEQSATHARFKATISYHNDSGKGGQVATATGHGSETEQDFPDFFEKAETKAIGRACAVLGYGTDAAVDFDDETPRDGAGAAKAELRAVPDEPRRMEPRERAQVDATYAEVSRATSPAPDGHGKNIRGPAPRALNKAQLIKALQMDGWNIPDGAGVKQIAQDIEFQYDGEEIPTNESGSYWPSDIWDFLAQRNEEAGAEPAHLDGRVAVQY